DNVAQKSFSCSFCKKCFERRSDCKRHERIHDGVRPHNCEHPDCGKKFNRPSALIVHMRVHTGEKPHMCETCGKPFSDTSALGRHRQIHSGKKLHKCPYENCQKTFTRRPTMIRHKNHHTETIQEAAIATAVALATRAGSSRGGRQRSDGEQYSNNRSPMSTLSPSQRHLTTSPYSKLDHLNSHLGEYQYINNNHLSGYVQGGYHMQGQQPTTTASYSNGMRPTSHATVYGSPSILEPPTNSDRRLGSTVSSLYMNSAGYQSLSQSNANMYPDPEYY
ncbi:zinc finger protein, partial [Leptodontidium sp. MPI-SDFR-AT-0119]